MGPLAAMTAAPALEQLTRHPQAQMPRIIVPTDFKNFRIDDYSSSFLDFSALLSEVFEVI